MRSTTLMRRLAPQAGFTLLELMLVITVAAVILGIAVPNMRQFMLNNRMTGAANDLLTAVYRARSESINRRTQTVLCFVTNQADPPVCGGDGSQGWAVFVDADADGAADAGEEVIMRRGALPNTIRVGSKPAGNAGYLAFNRSGFAREIALGTDLAGVVMCDSRGNVAVGGAANSAARGLLISPTGRPQITRSVATIQNNADLGGCP